MTTEQMQNRLQQTFANAQVAVVDLTGTNDHFEVRILSSELAALPRVRQHQAVMGVFADELKTGEVHALSIRVLPKE